MTALLAVAADLAALLGAAIIAGYGLRSGWRIADALRPPKSQTVVFEHRHHPEHVRLVADGLLEMGSLPVTDAEARRDARLLLGCSPYDAEETSA